jgi:hypothetical protein
MAIFTLEEAARFSGRSPREVRLLIESGAIPGRQRAGRWTVASQDLERTLAPRAPEDGESHPPVGAEPPDPFAPAAQPDRTLDRDARLLERVRRIERELAEMRGRLEEANAKVAELGGDPAGAQEGPQETAGAETEGMREALTPLFRSKRKPPAGDEPGGPGLGETQRPGGGPDRPPAEDG